MPTDVEPAGNARAGAERGRGELAARIGSSLVLAPLALAVTWIEAPALAGAVGAGGVILAREWTRMSDPDAPDLAFALAAAGAAGATIAASAGMMLLAAAICVGAAALAFIAASPRGRGADAGLGVLYISAPCAVIVWLRLQGDPLGSQLVTFLFASVWGADIGAYVAGRTIGGPRFATSISPTKTWAGVIGGVALGTCFGAVAMVGIGWEWNVASAAAVAACLSAAGLGGDLLESALKRRYGVKDSGALIPGHGGLLDRVDGLMLAALALGVWVAIGQQL